MASTRDTGVVDVPQGLVHEAIGCGTGDGGVLGRRARARYDPRHAGRRPRVAVDAAAPAKSGATKKAKKKKAKKSDGRCDCVRAVAHEVTRSHFTVQTRNHRGIPHEQAARCTDRRRLRCRRRRADRRARQADHARKSSRTSRPRPAPAAAATTGAQTAKEQAANVEGVEGSVEDDDGREERAMPRSRTSTMVNPENPSGSVAGTAASSRRRTWPSRRRRRSRTPSSRPRKVRSSSRRNCRRSGDASNCRGRASARRAGRFAPCPFLSCGPALRGPAIVIA